jgi:hypothetical protein
LKEALIYAKELSITETILEHPHARKISGKDLGKALLCAKHFSVVETILQHQNANQISGEVLGESLSVVLSLPFVKAILNSQYAAQISPDALGNALQQHSQAQRTSTVQFILESKYADKISNTDLRYALESAARSVAQEVRAETVTTILQSRHASRISISDLNNIFYVTASSPQDLSSRALVFLKSGHANKIREGLLQLTSRQTTPLLEHCSFSQLFQIFLSALSRTEWKLAWAVVAQFFYNLIGYNSPRN